MFRTGARPTGTVLSLARLARLAGLILVSSVPFASCGRSTPVPTSSAPPSVVKSYEAGIRVDAVPVTVTSPDDAIREVSRLSALLSEAESLGEKRIVAYHELPFRSKLGYQPRRAQGLDRVSKSGLALGESELATLGRLGFVVSDSKRMLTFFAGYERIYAEHLPLYVTIDSILYALHRSYDQILSTVEQTWLAPALKDLLAGARNRLAALPRDQA